ncbi:GyrI-like domain-containing protein [Schaalia suimastitidis]|uniref:GyrI-like domain-containing protein n=1 Tax=Schaalia suimastitidis TaxID=121163 RepID=UPI0003FB40C5|nr:GyrI-like domain-containing protein [Schaalia suimastitidis]
MVLDLKKEHKELYAPQAQPTILTVAPARYIAVRGQGDPNESDGDYAHTIAALYAVAYTIKMSKKGDRHIEGYVDFVVPPLEGFWWQDGTEGVDYANKAAFQWIALIRMPDFVTPEVVAWAAQTASAKKKQDFSCVEHLVYDEGLCVQCLHVGPYDDEPMTVASMHDYIAQQGYVLDISHTRHHHEIYLGDPRKVAPEKLRTIIRHPVRPK